MIDRILSFRMTVEAKRPMGDLDDAEMDKALEEARQVIESEVKELHRRLQEKYHFRIAVNHLYVF